MRRLLAVSLTTLALAGCVGPPQAPEAPPAPVIRPTPRPVPVPPPAPLASDWNDWPFTQGDWVYRRDARGSIALFGAGGGDAAMTLRCDRARAALYLSVRGPATPVTVRTTTINRVIPLQPTGGDAGYAATMLGPNDLLLDAMAFSRGRFVVERAGDVPLVVPPYAEIGRVIEDCRG
ncbi:hypothetical protein FPZ24_03905 [Sphingomonas panacisoli]|uniref:Lipoprotein n=1 Tax=Sphingomonas panacisoli TaxID=1813879 RepID=A0A5B8LEX5_9SPHN|nr:hypothetical protein [Sphingomonas panacisoli]QDZ06727.1 hypothetical protein FPZ24_03905 [Sphingomonas panacisoli]